MLLLGLLSSNSQKHLNEVQTNNTPSKYPDNEKIHMFEESMNGFSIYTSNKHKQESEKSRRKVRTVKKKKYT
jgi:hypothetical protein